MYALLDSGSTSSFLTKNIAEKLKLSPKTTTTLKVEGFNATQTTTSTVVDLQLSDIENRETYEWRNVYVVDNDQMPTVKELIEPQTESRQIWTSQRYPNATAQQPERRSTTWMRHACSHVS